LEDIYTTNMTPEYNKLVAGKRCNICHWVCELIRKLDNLN
jgi:hypothetical protein